jgi:hypothetical protein
MRALLTKPVTGNPFINFSGEGSQERRLVVGPGPLVQPLPVVSGVEDHRHAVVNRTHDRVRLGRNDRARLDRSTALAAQKGPGPAQPTTMRPIVTEDGRPSIFVHEIFATTPAAGSLLVMGVCIVSTRGTTCQKNP